MIILNAIIAVALALTPLGSQAAAPEPETLASYPHGAFLENLSRAPDGPLLVTSYIDKTLLILDDGSPARPLVTLDVHPVGILASRDRIVVSAHGLSFTDGPAFVGTNQMLVLDRSGRVLSRTPAPDAKFLNGLVRLPDDTLLVADSLAGRIWTFDPASGALTVWREDDRLGPDGANPRPGANGLKVRDGWLYVSNPSRGILLRTRLGATDAPFETFASPGPVDDFTFLSDGSIAGATHGDRLIRISSTGAVTDILSDGCDSCTSVELSPSGQLTVLTTGNLVEGGDQPARILRLPAP